METILNFTKEQLIEAKKELENQYDEYISKNLSLDMSRGKPSSEQLDINNELLNIPIDYKKEKGVDARNYGVLDGLKECKAIFGQLLDLEPEKIIIGGNSSLNMMYDTFTRLLIFGTQGEEPWISYRYKGEKVKFLCPSPGYDRHFAICQALGIEMITVPLREDGPDMDMVEQLVKSDELIKGIWCVPLHSNPQGVCYSDETVERLVSMKTAAKDFRIFWDNAYGVHHIYEEIRLRNIFEAAKPYNNENRIYYYFSTSKISFPGSGIALMASGKENIGEIKKHMSIQTIGHDKLNQLRHIAYFKNAEGIKAHMKVLANNLKPKFDIVIETLEKELGGTGLSKWSYPKGGYFVSVDTLPGCAKETVSLAKNAGVKLTDAGATYPYGIDVNDSNIRIAPSYPTIAELETAMKLFCLCVKLAGVRKLLEGH